MNARALDVWCFGETAGSLTDDGATLRFEYAPEWIAAGRPVLSQSLPLDGSFGPASVHAFFEGLLPEGELRDLLAARLGISPRNDFSMLEQIGGDCAGAISLFPAGHAPGPHDGGVTWLGDAEVAELVRELPRRPMYAEPDGELRLSLAGAQDKLPVVVENGVIGLPRGGRASTHILKTPIARLPATVLNEALWAAVGTRLGIDCARSHPHRAEGAEMLLVERYDRTVEEGGSVLRLHQEDFCQALSIDSDHKSEREGGPGLKECFALLRRAGRVPANEIPKLLDAWALSFVAANHDAHGKNYSILYGPDGAGLAPVYDVLNAAAYWKVKPMDRKMAMEVGGEYRPDYVHRRHLERMFKDAGLGSASARRRLRALASAAPDAIVEARAQLAREHWDHEHLDRIVEMGRGRASRLLDAVNEAP